MAGIFKAYDIRGVYGEDLSEDLFYKIGRAFVIMAGAKKLVVGHDMRLSSPHLSQSLIKGIIDQGCDVVDIGLASTPMVYFASGFLNLGSINVTASHNPAKYNGCKFTRDGTIPVSYDTGINEIERLVNENNFPEVEQKGKLEHKNVKSEYSDHVKKFAGDINKDLKIVIDFGNGMDSYTVPPIFWELDINYIPMYDKLVGNFPNHEANPLNPDNMKDLQEKVKEVNADLGIAFDGDGDRVGFVDEKGEIVSNDLTTAFFSKHILAENPGVAICYDLRSSLVVPEVINANGGRAEITSVGHTLIKQKMRDVDALFAGELSGHYYFKENFVADSAIIAAVKFLTLLTKEGKSVSEVFSEYRKYVSSGEVNSEVQDKDAIINELKGEHYLDAKEVHDFDGVLKRYDDWWFLVRPSNTEPLLRLIVEAKTEELMKEKVDELLNIIRK